MNIDPSDLWDRWVRARDRDASMDVATFCAREPAGAAELLATMLRAEAESPASPLFDVLLDGEGQRVFARHVLLRTLGQGGAGIVFLARRLSDGAVVALKVLNPLLAEVPQRRNLVLREAEIARRLRHPGIVAVLDAGVERGHAWITSEHCDGERADRWVAAAATGAERVERALRVATQVAHALGHAHAQEIVHRDVKPQNVLVERDGRARVLDFGLARADGVAFAISGTGDLLGTPLYMAPEQVRAEDAHMGPASDVHALGLMLWELATGASLADRGAPWRMLERAGAGRLRLTRRDVDLLPESLRDVVARCAEPDPRDRPRDGNELAAELERAAQGLPPRARRLSGARRTWLRLRREPGRPLIALALGIVVTAGCGYAWWTWPVKVRFDEERGGKTLWIDGQEVGTTPIDLELRPGEHAWRAAYPDATLEPYRGTFRVEPRTPLIVHVVLDPPNGCPTLESPFDLRPGEWGWIQVSTPEERVELEVGPHRLAGIQGIAAIRVPFGTHALRLASAGKRPIEWTAEVREQRLHSYSFELDATDSPWTTILAYSPIDERVRDALVGTSGARLYYENQRILGQGSYADRAYFGPAESYEPAVVDFVLLLPARPTDLEIEILCSTVSSGPGAWSRVEIGWPGDDLLLADEIRLGRRAPPGPQRHDAATLSFWDKVDPRVVAELLSRGARCDRLRVRWSAGGVAAGGSESAHAQILRSEALPARLETGPLLWSPSMIVRVR